VQADLGMRGVQVIARVRVLRSMQAAMEPGTTQSNERFASLQDLSPCSEMQTSHQCLLFNVKNRSPRAYPSMNRRKGIQPPRDLAHRLAEKYSRYRCRNQIRHRACEHRSHAEARQLIAPFRDERANAADLHSDRAEICKAAQRKGRNRK
jgi:hypothetical protein